MLRILNPSVKAVKCTYGIAHAYHTLKFSCPVQATSNCMDNQMSITYYVNADTSRDVFARGFVAASYARVLACKANLSPPPKVACAILPSGLGEIPTAGSRGGCPASTEAG